MTKETTALGSS